MLWVLLGCLAVYLLFWVTDFDRQRAKLPRLIEQAKALGMPVTAEEYGQVLAVPDEQNAAPLYQDLAKEIRSLDEQKPEVIKLVRNHGLRQVDPASVEMQEAIAATEIADNLLRRAAELPAYRINRLADSNGKSVEPLVTLRIALKLGLFRVFRDVLLDRPEEALDRLEWMLALIPHSLVEPSKLAILTWAGNSGRWMEALNVVVKRHHAKPGVLDRADALLDRLPPLPPFKTGCLGEVAFALAYGETMTGADIDAFFPKGTRFPLSRPYFRSQKAIDAYIAFAVEESIGAYRRLPDDPTDWMRIGIAIQTHHFMREWWKRPSYAMNLWVHNSAEAIPSHITRERMARLGIQLYREFARTAAFPAQLPATEEARDARSGRPFAYSATGNGFSLQAQRIIY